MEVDKLIVLKSKLKKEGIHHNSLVPGKYACILCPKVIHLYMAISMSMFYILNFSVLFCYFVPVLFSGV